jgi:hypothetical protein
MSPILAPMRRHVHPQKMGAARYLDVSRSPPPFCAARRQGYANRLARARIEGSLRNLALVVFVDAAMEIVYF